MVTRTLEISGIIISQLVLIAQACPTLATPGTLALSHGFSRQEYTAVCYFLLGSSPNPGIDSGIQAGGSFTTEPPQEASRS